MNTIKGMIEDLRRDETHIGGCTTKGELIIALESLERNVKIPYNATNGDMIKALFPKAMVYEAGIAMDVEFPGCEEHWFNKDWWNAPYKKE